MFGKLFQSLEDPQRPLLGPNYWLLKMLCLVLPESKIGKFCCFLYHGIPTYFVVTQYIELYGIRSNLDLVLTNIRVSMLSTICVLKANLFLLNQDKWMEIINYVTASQAFEVNNPVSKKTNSLLDSSKKYCCILTYSYWCLLFATALIVDLTPVAIIRFSSPSYRENLRNGSEPFPHIYSSWAMFNKYQFPGLWLMVVWHVLITMYGASAIACFDSLVIVIIHSFGVKLELLRERCKVMFGTDETEVSDDEAYRVVRQLHTIHAELFKYSRLMNSLLSPIMFIYVMMCTFMLCSSGYQLTNAASQTLKIFKAQYLIFGIAQLFIFCWHSNDVLYKSREVMRGPYESQWWVMNVKTRKMLLNLAGQLSQVHCYSAGPFTYLTLGTFINILKGSYSYYTLLRK